MLEHDVEGVQELTYGGEQGLQLGFAARLYMFILSTHAWIQEGLESRASSAICFCHLSYLRNYKLSIRLAEFLQRNMDLPRNEPQEVSKSGVIDGGDFRS